MAAIDKIYLNSYDEYREFRDWCLEQPKLKDKYGKEVSIYSYFFTWLDDPEYWKDNKSHPVFSAPYYVDAYLIRNCHLKYVQKELMVNYGHKTQEDIDEMYNTVINRTAEDQKLIDEANGTFPSKPISWWWLNEDDFEIVGDIIKIPRLEKSAYEKIRDGELYTSPTLEGTYPCGKHFKIIKLPFYNARCNYPMKYSNKAGVRKQPDWDISVKLPEEYNEYLWWHDHGRKIGTWDFSSEFVSGSKWSSSQAWCPSLESIKRRILKWKLPIGTIVTLRGMYVDETYKIIIKK